MLHKIHMTKSSIVEVNDLRDETQKIGDAIRGGRANYVLSTNKHNIYFGAHDRYVADGGNDMFDNANFTSPVRSSNRSLTSPSTGASTSDHPDSIYYGNTSAGGISAGTYVHPNVSDFSYVAGGWTSNGNEDSNGGALVVAGTTGNSGNQWCGWMVGGNSGADGTGSKSQVDLYNGATVSGFTVYSSYMSTYNASDPSCNSLYMLIGHPKWGTSFGTINKYNSVNTQFFNSAMWSESTSQNNVLAVYLLTARTGGNLPVQSEMQDIVDEVISDLKAEFGY